MVKGQFKAAWGDGPTRQELRGLPSFVSPTLSLMMQTVKYVDVNTEFTIALVYRYKFMNRLQPSPCDLVETHHKHNNRWGANSYSPSCAEGVYQHESSLNNGLVGISWDVLQPQPPSSHNTKLCLKQRMVSLLLGKDETHD